VVGTSQVGVDQEGTSLAVSKAISDAQAFPNYNNSYNSLGDTRAINLASSGVKDSDLSKFCAVINSYTFNLEALYLNNNAIGNSGIAELIPAIKGSKYTMYRQFENGQSVYPPRIVAEDLRFLNYKYDPSNPKFITQNVVFLNLCNNNIGDRGAKTLADALKSGELQSTKEIDLHGNSITKTGYGYVIDGVKNSPNSKLTATFFEILKEDIKTIKNGSKNALKDFINYAKNQGVEASAIATSKSILDHLKNAAVLTGKYLGGVIKCKTRLDYIDEGIDGNDVAIEVLIKAIGKKFGPTDTLVCLVSPVEEAFVTTEGVDLAVKTIELLGDNG
jgi:hypothetical protein